MKDKFKVTGLMSGSSMDGIDLACCDFNWDGYRWNYRILKAETIPYEADLKSKLELACDWGMDKIQELDVELGAYYASLLNDFHQKNALHPDLIASHGHTILHEPHLGVTFQAGKGSVMAERTGIMVVNDFRSEDVAQGGQGAPLVPLGDSLLFGEYEGCINLGGIANISFDNEKGQRMAYDLSHANMALNHVAGLKGLEFDKDGALARQGSFHPGLFEKMNQLEYYHLPAPKSLGREWFMRVLLPIMKHSGLSTEDLMATVLEHIAFQVAKGINQASIKSVLITGGGALNHTLIERISHHTDAEIIIPEQQIIHYKEALIFGLLGVLRVRGEINCLSNVTGGRKDLSAGTIHTIKTLES